MTKYFPVAFVGSALATIASFSLALATSPFAILAA